MGILFKTNEEKEEAKRVHEAAKKRIVKGNQISEMSDRELQESIAKNLRIVTRNSKSISGWMTFIGLLLIANVIGAIYLVSQM